MPYLIVLLLLMTACGTKPPMAAESAPPASGEFSAEARRNAGIEVVTAREDSREVHLEAPGQLTWNQERTWSVGAVATGKIATVTAQVGDFVKTGQVLARFHTHDVHDTQANLLQALSDRRRAVTHLEQLKRNSERLKRLYQAKAAPLMQVEQAESEVKMAEEDVEKAQANIDRETQHLTEVLDIPVRKEHAHAGPHEGEGGEDELVPIKAPHDGLVVERNISVGAVVSLGQAAFVVADPESLWLIANFPESSLPRLRVGLPLTVEVRAYPGRTFPARIRRLGESMDAASRTLKVVVELASRRALKPEMFATVKLSSPGARAIVVPASAVQEVDGKQVVFVEDTKEHFTARPVRAEISEGFAILHDGIKAGERVAAQGSYMIKSQKLQKATE